VGVEIFNNKTDGKKGPTAQEIIHSTVICASFALLSNVCSTKYFFDMDRSGEGKVLVRYGLPWDSIDSISNVLEARTPIQRFLLFAHFDKVRQKTLHLYDEDTPKIVGDAVWNYNRPFTGVHFIQ
jgi:hypothetical protein